MVNTRPLIAQSDQSLLLDAHDPAFEEARAALSAFATLEKSPEHFHSYRLDALSLWNAASAGLTPEAVVETLRRYSRYELPVSLAQSVQATMGRFGRITIDSGETEGSLVLLCDDPFVRAEISGSRKLGGLLAAQADHFQLQLVDRGTVKRELIKIGWPAMDLAPLQIGDPYHFNLRTELDNGQAFGLRPYQQDALDAFIGRKLPGTGYGVVVMPKTSASIPGRPSRSGRSP